jgi:hypothetical protein
MDRDFTKAQRRRLRELGALAYERELSTELANLEFEFKRWRGGEIDTFALSEAVHRFHQGPAQQLFSKYEDANLDFAVAAAIHRGFLSEEQVGAEMVELLSGHLAFLRGQAP